MAVGAAYVVVAAAGAAVVVGATVVVGTTVVAVDPALVIRTAVVDGIAVSKLPPQAEAKRTGITANMVLVIIEVINTKHRRCLQN